VLAWGDSLPKGLGNGSTNCYLYLRFLRPKNRSELSTNLRNALLVLVVEVSARRSSVLSISVRMNVITDINIFVQALNRKSSAYLIYRRRRYSGSLGSKEG